MTKQPTRLSRDVHVYAAPIEPILPEGWLTTLREVLEDLGVPSDVHGGCVGSGREGPPAVGLRLVDGLALASAVPWLTELYRGPLLEMASGLGLADIETVPDLASAINLQEHTEEWQHDWHVERDPMVVMLGVVVPGFPLGGSLAFRGSPVSRRAEGNGHDGEVGPASGHATFFDFRRVPHSVTPPAPTLRRVSVAMRYQSAHGDDAAGGDSSPYELPVRDWSDKRTSKWYRDRARETHGRGFLRKMQRARRDWPDL